MGFGCLAAAWGSGSELDEAWGDVWRDKGVGGRSRSLIGSRNELKVRGWGALRGEDFSSLHSGPPPHSVPSLSSQAFGKQSSGGTKGQGRGAGWQSSAVMAPQHLRSSGHFTFVAGRYIKYASIVQSQFQLPNWQLIFKNLSNK